MKKTTIKNRKGQNIVVCVNQTQKQKGLAIVMHGLGGFKEQPHIRTFALAFEESGYTVVTFDTTNTFGESDGNYKDATITNYHEDLEDVISWVKIQPWYEEPYILVGHSLGGICTALYSQKYPKEVKALAPISTVVSGQLLLEALGTTTVNKWKTSGWFIEESTSRPGKVKKLKWSFAENSLDYDLLKNIDKLIMPTLLMTGSKDFATSPKYQRILFNKLPGTKEFHVINNASHTFRDKKHLDEIKSIFLKWIESLD
jgi:pimeloyl-ACP methyl ester carboxylesterase